MSGGARRSLTYVEIDVDHCDNTYGIAPCKARLGYVGAEGPFGVLLDGSTAWLTRGAGLTGAADSKQFTFSCWIRRNSLQALGGRLLATVSTLGGGTANAATRLVLNNGANQFNVVGLNAAGTQILNLNTTGVPSQGSLVHILCSVDLTSTLKRWIYVDDAADINSVTYTNDTIDFTMADWGIGAYPDGSNPFDGSLFDLWFQPGLYLDLSVEANRRLFITADKRPVNLGPAGAGPTGSAPLVFMAGSAVDSTGWSTNKGTGGGFTLHGSLENDSFSDRKCFNSLHTCQDRGNFVNGPITLRYAAATHDLPADIDAIPSIAGVSFTPATLSLGKDLGVRATLSVTFKDHRTSDTGPEGDKYPETRSYNPYDQGTYFGKFRARYPFLVGRAIRWITGTLGQAIEDMETRHYLIDGFTGPSPDGTYQLTGKDILKLADGDKSQAPNLSDGFLVADITNSQTTAVLSPTGVGDAEYPASGYVCIGGNEVCGFFRDPFTVLLLNFDGLNAAVTTIDESPTAKAVTFHGAAAISTAQAAIGSASISLGIAGNWISLADSADWTMGTGDFSIECFVYYATVPSGAPNAAIDNYVWWQQNGTVDQHNFGFDGTDFVYSVVSGSTVRGSYHAAHGMSNNTWYHWRVSRVGTNVFVHRNGVSVALTTTTAISTNAVPDVNGAFNIGGQSFPGPSFVDGFRITKGLALSNSTASFTPPAAPLALAGSGDNIVITRGQFNTVAVAHSAQDRVQLCLQYLAESPADIMYDLFTYTDVDLSWLPLASWQTECSTFLNRLYTTLITEPTPVTDLLSELIEQAGLVMWWDDVNQQVRLQVLRSVSTDAAVYGDDNIVRGTLTSQDQFDKRISEVWTYYGRIDPTKELDQVNNYRSALLTDDLQSASDYGSAAVYVIYSRWIPAFGRSVASRLNEILLARFRDPPRLLNWKLMRYASATTLDVALGGGYQVSAWAFQDDQGARELVPVQVTRLNPTATMFEVEAEEMLFVQFAGDSNIHTVLVDANVNNFNLRTVHDTLFPAPVSGTVVACIIQEGVIVGSASTSTPAFDVGLWPPGVTVTVTVVGRIQGRGGNGGFNEGNSSTRDGLAGGLALLVRYAINLVVASGEIWGGGGGGGVGGLNGGGGGAGQLPGVGGGGTPNQTSSSGTNGTTEAGGAGGPIVSGGPAINGGQGGGPGLHGENKNNSGVGPNTVGGAAGNAVDGISFVTVVGGAGDIRGAEIN